MIVRGDDVGVVIEPQRDQRFVVLWEPLFEQRETVELRDPHAFLIIMQRETQQEPPAVAA